MFIYLPRMGINTDRKKKGLIMATLRKSDFTNEAIEIGLWDALLESAGISPEADRADDVEIEILKAKNADTPDYDYYYKNRG